MRCRSGAPAVLLLVEYDGGAFYGYQRQREGPSVQSVLEEAWRGLTGGGVRLTASGRTDRGVHARGLLVLARGERLNVPVERLPEALSAHLPPEVAVRAAWPVPASFHPRRHVLGKRYRYRILEGRVRSPWERGRVWHLGRRLDLVAMRRAARRLVGRHDFAAFASEAGSRRDTVRHVRSIRISRRGEVVEVEVEGDGFLYNMVRAMVGSLVEVGRGRFPPEWVGEVLRSRDRRRAGRTAPAEGLVLVEVLPLLERVRG